MITNDIFIEVNNYNLYQLSLYDLKEYFKTDAIVLSLFGFSSPLGLMLGKEALLKNDDLVVRIASIIVKEKEVSKL